MKTFTYYIGVFIIVSAMFAFPILATLSFCLNWNFVLKGIFAACTVVDFITVMPFIAWCIDDFSDG